jgi:integrase/recombinase XerD
LEEYLREREQPIPRTWKKENKSDYVFISHNSGYDFGKPISKETVCSLMKKYSDLLNIWKRITVHSLRHSYATRLLESWLNIREIQELLWHKDLKTTETYCHVLKSSLEKKVNLIFN